jgi:predicted transposase YdaD
MRLNKIHDILHEMPLYQEILRAGSEEGLARGRKEGHQEGHTEGLQIGIREGQFKAQRRAILSIVQERFPRLELLAKKQIAMSSDADRLNGLIVQLSVVNDEREATRLLYVDNNNPRRNEGEEQQA